MRPVLFYTVGYPGSGKTTLAVGLSFWLGGVHLRADKVGLELFRFPTFSPAERQAVHEEMRRRAGEALRGGKAVIYDAATNAAVQRADVAALGHSLGVPTVGLWLKTPTEVAMRRAGKLRDQGLVGPIARIIPPEIFMQYVRAFETPGPQEDVIALSGEAPFALQYRRLCRSLQLRNVAIAVPKMVQ